MHNPRLKTSILLSPVEGGYVAYDTETDRLHRLNPVASLIVELCDGAHTIAQIEQSVGPLLPNGNASAVRQWIEEARRGKLLIAADVAAAKHCSLTSDQLAELAERLREQGKIHAAFLCQQRAAAIEPDSPSHWWSLGELAHIAGRRDEARASYEHYLALRPDDAEVRHILVALSDETPPARVPDECIQQLYKRFSTFYDSNLVDELDYAAPERLSDAIDTVFPQRNDLAILDLGCGTGLSGEQLRPRAERLDGIDLSPEMTAAARKRNLYDKLDVAEITTWLQSAAQNDNRHAASQYDLIVACDTLIYFGDLAQVVSPAAALLNDGGAIAFSVERAAQAPYVLTDSGRYAHHADHIEQVAKSAGLSMSYHQESFLRTEYGEDVVGHIVVMREGSADH